MSGMTTAMVIRTGNKVTITCFPNAEAADNAAAKLVDFDEGYSIACLEDLSEISIDTLQKIRDHLEPGKKPMRFAPEARQICWKLILSTLPGNAEHGVDENYGQASAPGEELVADDGEASEGDEPEESEELDECLDEDNDMSDVSAEEVTPRKRVAVAKAAAKPAKVVKAAKEAKPAKAAKVAKAVKAAPNEAATKAKPAKVAKAAKPVKAARAKSAAPAEDEQPVKAAKATKVNGVAKVSRGVLAKPAKAAKAVKEAKPAKAVKAATKADKSAKPAKATAANERRTSDRWKLILAEIGEAGDDGLTKKEIVELAESHGAKPWFARFVSEGLLDRFERGRFRLTKQGEKFLSENAA